MSPSFRPPAALAVVAAAAVISAGCGSSHDSGGANIAAAPAATTSGSGIGAARGEAVRFAECMRTNGVSGFPYLDRSGELTIDGVANRSSIDTNSAAFEHALSVCKGLEPPGFTGSKATSQQRVARLEFARCVRKNGVPDFPDPTANGPLVDTNRIPSAATPGGMSILHASMEKCGRYASAAGVQANR